MRYCNCCLNHIGRRSAFDWFRQPKMGADCVCNYTQVALLPQSGWKSVVAECVAGDSHHVRKSVGWLDLDFVSFAIFLLVFLYFIPALSPSLSWSILALVVSTTPNITCASFRFGIQWLNGVFTIPGCFFFFICTVLSFFSHSLVVLRRTFSQTCFDVGVVFPATLLLTVLNK